MFRSFLSPPPVFALQPARAQQICQEIAGVVAGEFELALAEVKSATRGAPRAAYARQVSMYLAHVSFALSFEAIGRVFHRDRTTVAHACRVVEDSRDDARLDRQLAGLERMCREVSGECFCGAADADI